MDIFPNVSEIAIRADLAITNDVETTVDNILHALSGTGGVHGNDEPHDDDFYAHGEGADAVRKVTLDTIPEAQDGEIEGEEESDTNQ